MRKIEILISIVTKIRIDFKIKFQNILIPITWCERLKNAEISVFKASEHQNSMVERYSKMERENPLMISSSSPLLSYRPSSYALHFSHQSCFSFNLFLCYILLPLKTPSDQLIKIINEKIPNTTFWIQRSVSVFSVFDSQRWFYRWLCEFFSSHLL